MDNFTHLHVHSHYSLLDGLPKIDRLIANAKKKGFAALALTDHGAMYGCLEFYKKAVLAGLKPILGMETYVAIDSLSDKRARIDNDYYHLVLLAQNFEGYQNLMRLSTIAHLDGFYYRPRIDKPTLEKYSANLIALSGCMRGDIPRALINSDYEKAVQLVADYKRIFGDRFYLEIQRHESTDPEYDKKEKTLNERLVKLAQETQTLLVATNDAHYLEKEDADAQDTLLCVGLGKTVNDTDRLDMRGVDISLKSLSEMKTLFKDLPEALSNTQKVVDSCNLEIPIGQRSFPDFQVPQGFTPDSYLIELSYQGLAKKYNIDPELDVTEIKTKIPGNVVERLEYELNIIIKKNYATYFLVVADFVNWARNRRIITTTRGSAAGSLVSYSIGITTINPLDYKLPFERFLTLERPLPPDIDMDFADARRDEVIEYVTHKYGEDKVAQIVTFGTMMARAAIRDVGRALAVPYAKCDKIAKMIPFGKYGFHMTIDNALTLSPELKEAYDKDPETKRLIDLSLKLEGVARHASVHAAGIVIAPRPLTEFTPLQREQEGKIITQYDMYSIEDSGLVKMDFLGIRNLSILGNTVEIVEHLRGIKIDLNNLPLDDQKTYELLSRGKTMGLFQLGGSGMTRYLKDLQPTNIFDIMAMISLYRPGPIDSIPEYIRRKHNPKLVTFTDPKMVDILSESHGIITYQDDVLLIAIQIAGYTWEEADKLRKAMGKKIPKEMAAQKEKFLEGCVKHSNYTKERAQNLWHLIEPFAAYGFNKAHAASYAIVAYQTSYMKANFPVEFMAAVMTAESGDPVTIADAVEECKSMKIEILPPDVNESLANFTVIDNNHIRFGLAAIKNLGSDVIATIIAQRKVGGHFASVEDFIIRSQTKNFNKKSWEALSKSGALDSLGERNKLLANTETILEFSKSILRAQTERQVSLFGTDQKITGKLKLRDVEPAAKKDKLIWEKELLGLYVTAHPLDEYAQILRRSTKAIKESAGLAGMITFGGIVNKVQKILTKKGEQMAFVEFEDLTGMIEVLVFPSLFQKYSNLLVPEKILIITGKISDKDGTPKFLAEEIKDLALSRTETKETSVTIKIPETAGDELFIELKKLFESYPGELSVSLQIKNQQVKTPFKVSLSDELKNKIKQLLE
ncbi:MAG TPA: DNA polymerase III subunit alpha [Patescibacteria group bacterium]|jgi:DNA polymerase-3 subunit alpha|nr:DNA polymerase III subunit alpha [Patescibacteria group bacterium]